MITQTWATVPGDKCSHHSTKTSYLIRGKISPSLFSFRRLTGVLSTASQELIKFKDILKELDREQSFVQEFFSMEHFSFVTDSKLTR